MKTVLLVDDTEVIRVVVSAFLRRFPCTVVEAVNGRIGLEKARELKPDLILLDVEMPEMDGIEALRHLREDPATQAIPVIMLTAQSSKEVVMQAARHGVLAYIVKPVNRQLFDKEVGKVLGAVSGAGAPVAEAAPEADAAPEAAPQFTSLVVDDSQRVCETVRAPLSARGPVIVASTGMQALERFQEEHPRVVILDLTLPDIDAFDLLIAMRQVDDSARFLALTVRGEADQAGRALRAGFAGVIEKPVQAAEVLDKVAAALGDQAEEVFVEWVDDTPVLVFPAADAPAFQRFTQVTASTVRDIVNDGGDHIVIDLSAIVDLTPGVARILLRLVDEVRTRGLRAAVCAPTEQLVHQLGEINETRGLLCAPSRPEAMKALGSTSAPAPTPPPAPVAATGTDGAAAPETPPPAVGPAPAEPPK
jgi:two-component system, chemotaxis family, chemotaxis protein CheY